MNRSIASNMSLGLTIRSDVLLVGKQRIPVGTRFLSGRRDIGVIEIATVDEYGIVSHVAHGVARDMYLRRGVGYHVVLNKMNENFELWT
jgi:hypothetical protein